MSGIGGTELIIIGAILVVLFGAPMLTFLFGYSLGRKRGALPPAEPPQEDSPKETSSDE